MNKFGRVLLVLLALFGVLVAIYGGVLWWLHYGLPSDARIREIWRSPDGTFKAVQFIQSGGGGPASYCFEMVSVVPNVVSDKQAWGDVSNVFATGCGSLKSVVWISNNLLEITFDPNRGVREISAIKLKGTSDAGRIRISYVFKGDNSN